MYLEYENRVYNLDGLCKVSLNDCKIELYFVPFKEDLYFSSHAIALEVYNRIKSDLSLIICSRTCSSLEKPVVRVVIEPPAPIGEFKSLNVRKKKKEVVDAKEKE